MRVTIPKGAFNPAYLPLLFEEGGRDAEGGAGEESAGGAGRGGNA